MYARTSRYYDAIYSWNDYAGGAARVGEIIAQRAKLGRAPATLLDVACGTGKHLSYLQAHFQVEGLDLDEGMLSIARERLPGVPLHHGDMQSFDLGKRFDAVICLFGSIAAMLTTEALQQAICSVARHTNPGGVVIIEPWLEPGKYREGSLHSLFVDEPDLKIARMNISAREGDIAVVEFHYLIGAPEGITTTTETIRLGLFTREEYLAAFTACGLQAEHDEHGLMGRGAYIAQAPEGGL